MNAFRRGADPTVTLALIQAMQAQGANFDAQGRNGETALMFAFEHQADPKVTLALIEAIKEQTTPKANFAAQDRGGWTALMLACRDNADPKVTLALIGAMQAQGANFAAATEHGMTAFMLGMRHPNPQGIVTLLIQNIGPEKIKASFSGKSLARFYEATVKGTHLVLAFETYMTHNTAYRLSNKPLTNRVKKLEAWAHLTLGGKTNKQYLERIFPWSKHLLETIHPKNFVASLNQLIQHYLKQNQGFISRLFRSTPRKAFAAPLLKSILNPDLLSRIAGFLAPTTHPLNETYVLTQLFDMNPLPEDKCETLHNALSSIQAEDKGEPAGKRPRPACLDPTTDFDEILAFAAANKQTPTV